MVRHNNTGAAVDHGPEEKQRAEHLWGLGLPQTVNKYSQAMLLWQQMRSVVQTRKHHRHEVHGNLPRMSPKVPMARRLQGNWRGRQRQLHLPKQRARTKWRKWKRKRKKIKRPHTRRMTSTTFFSTISAVITFIKLIDPRREKKKVYSFCLLRERCNLINLKDELRKKKKKETRRNKKRQSFGMKKDENKKKEANLINLIASN